MATSATFFGNDIVEWLLDPVPESEVDALLNGCYHESNVSTSTALRRAAATAHVCARSSNELRLLPANGTWTDCSRASKRVFAPPKTDEPHYKESNNIMCNTCWHDVVHALEGGLYM